MKKQALFALLVAAVLLLSGCALVTVDKDKDNARVVLDVNGETLTKGEIANEVEYTVYMNNYYNQLYQNYFGQSMGYDTNYSSVLSTVLDNHISNFVQLQKAKELGLDAFSDEENEAIKTEAQENYDSMLDEIKTSYLDAEGKTDEELHDEAVAYAEANDYAALEDYVINSTNAKLLAKLEEETVKDVTVTDEELQAALDEKVESAKSTYESSVSSYGYSVNNGTDVFYTPAGYRYVKQILIGFTEEDKAVTDEKDTALSDAKTVLSDAQTALSDAIAPLTEAQTAVADAETALTEAKEALEAAGEDADTAALQAAVDEAQTKLDEANAALPVAEDAVKDVDQATLQAAVDEAQAQVDAAQAALDEAQQAAFDNIKPRVDEVMAKIEAGEDFAALIEEYNEDPGMQSGVTAENGYAITNDYLYFDSAFVNAAMALANPGDISEPVASTLYGYYIIRYENDIPEGPKTLDEVRDTVTEEVLGNKKDEAYEAAVTEWIGQANVKSYPEKMGY